VTLPPAECPADAAAATPERVRAPFAVLAFDKHGARWYAGEEESACGAIK